MLLSYRVLSYSLATTKLLANLDTWDKNRLAETASALYYACCCGARLLRMLMPKKDRVLIYEYLFKEGVMVAQKNPHKPRHPNVPVPNLFVMKALQSLKSRGYVQEQFAWRHYYWTLTNEGITYLRDFLHLPSEIVPATLKRPTRAETARPRAAAPRPDAGKLEGDRAAYRRAGDAGPDKKGEAGAGAGQMEFRGGFGRGRGAPPQ